MTASREWNLLMKEPISTMNGVNTASPIDGNRFTAWRRRFLKWILPPYRHDEQDPDLRALQRPTTVGAHLIYALVLAFIGLLVFIIILAVVANQNEEAPAWVHSIYSIPDGITSLTALVGVAAGALLLFHSSDWKTRTAVREQYFARNEIERRDKRDAWLAATTDLLNAVRVPSPSKSMKKELTHVWGALQDAGAVLVNNGVLEQTTYDARKVLLRRELVARKII